MVAGRGLYVAGAGQKSRVRIESSGPLVKLGYMEELKVPVKCRRSAVVPVC